MSILAPVMALVSAVMPIAVGLGRGERLSGAGYAGIAVGVVAIVLICIIPGEHVVRPTGRALLTAVGAGIGVGGYLVAIDLSPATGGPAPLVASFAVTVIAVAAVVGALAALRARGSVDSVALRLDTPPATTPRRGIGPLGFAILSGATDATAAALFLVALRLGDLSVVSVLQALSPAGTILLAAIVLRERIAAVQWSGLGLALVAAALLALA
jgi:drug/metabolite transporter (DMT)-like permease